MTIAISHKELDLEIFNCVKCPGVQEFRVYPMPGFYGSDCYGQFAVIAQNPGTPNEYQRRHKFVFSEIEEDYIDGLKKSPIGMFLDLILPSNINLEQVFYTNIVKCAKKEQNLDDEAANCDKYIARQLDIVKPKIIITLGNLALRYFCPGMNIKAASLKHIEHDRRWLVLPLFHPSYLNRLSYEEGKKYIEDANKLISYHAGLIFR